MGFMHKLGLRSAGDYAELQIDLDNERAEVKRLRGLLADREAAFKKAIGDLANQAREIAVLKDAVEQADALRPDAQKWRDRAAREHERRSKTRTSTPKKGASK